MKKLGTLLLVTFAMVLGLTQCKKKVDTIATPNNIGEPVHITLNVGGGDRHIVYPGTGAVVYTDGDVIYVGNGGKYIGYLTYGSGAFSGDIYSPSTEDYLHFYFVGGLTPSDTPEAGSTTDFTVNIADQSGILPVLSYGCSTEKYTTSTATYGCTLLNKCGLVKFVPAIATSETVTVGGMKTTATIDFADPGITPTATTGNITLYSESNAAKWAILLVQNEVSTPTVTIDGYNATIESVPAITANMYYTDGVDIEMEEVKPYIDGNFTVANGRTVTFSRGNLQYLGTGDDGTMTPKWRFADNQYDIMGNGTNGNVSIAGYTSYNYGSAKSTPTDADKQAARDLFGWGTSGWDNGNYFFQPYSTSRSESSPYTAARGYGYGPTNGSTYTCSLTGDYANADWGVYNKQSNQNKIEGGGDHAWRVLTNAEWVYVFNTRNTASRHRYAKATVCGVQGIILLPDNWSDDTYSLKNYNTTGAAYTGNTIDPDGWATLEAAGCVFLPAVGYRYGEEVRNVGSYGGYWSSTCTGTTSGVNYVYFGSSVTPSNSNKRYYGYSVRLVF